MKTQNIKFDYSNLTDEQLKAVAILQHTGDDFFILDDKIFDGDINEAFEAFMNSEDLKADDKDLTIQEAVANYNFYEYCLFNSVNIEPYDENDYNMAYMCLTDDEADDKAKEYIKDSLWAFNSSFLSDRTGLPEEVFTAIAENGKCERNNDTIESLIYKYDSIDDFVDAAISADGRGHFMNSYDGEENEETVNGETYYIYRMN